MNFVQKVGSTAAIAGASLGLTGCGDPINNDNKFSQWTPQQVSAILAARSTLEIASIPNLKESIKKWIDPKYNSWDMQILQTKKEGYGVVEQNATISVKFGKIGEGTYFARFSNPKDPKEYKDFAIICANGLVQGMNNVQFTQNIAIPTPAASTQNKYSKDYIIPQGGSLIGTVGLTVTESKDIAKKYGLPSHYNKKGQYVVTVQPGDVVRVKPGAEGSEHEYEFNK